MIVTSLKIEFLTHLGVKVGDAMSRIKLLDELVTKVSSRFIKAICGEDGALNSPSSLSKRSPWIGLVNQEVRKTLIDELINVLFLCGIEHVVLNLESVGLEAATVRKTSSIGRFNKNLLDRVSQLLRAVRRLYRCVLVRFLMDLVALESISAHLLLNLLRDSGVARLCIDRFLLAQYCLVLVDTANQLFALRLSSTGSTLDGVYYIPHSQHMKIRVSSIPESFRIYQDRIKVPGDKTNSPFLNLLEVLFSVGFRINGTHRWRTNFDLRPVPLRCHRRSVIIKQRWDQLCLWKKLIRRRNLTFFVPMPLELPVALNPYNAFFNCVDMAGMIAFDETLVDQSPSFF
ncbi:hypothetical protein Tco_0881060 [Tanacetum coccineum]